MPLDYTIPDALKVDNFKQNTAHKENAGLKTRGRIHRIDDALLLLESAVKKGSPEALAKGLALVVANCAHWKQMKEKEFQALSEKKKEGRSTVDRMAAVDNVATIALQQLIYVYQHILASTQAADMAKALVKISENKAKVKAGASGLHIPKKTRSMEGTYSHERSLYLQSGKTEAPSATQLHQYHEDLKKYLGPEEFVGDGAAQMKSIVDAINLLPDEQAQAADKLIKKKFDSLTKSDYELLYSLVKPTFINPRKAEVAYFRKTSRIEYLVYFDQGHFFDIHGALYSSPNAIDGNAYAIDKYGYLYTSSGVAGMAFNHSTFNAGAPVICAGVIRITNGELKSIDNNSGHYKPSAENLWNAVRMFQDFGVDLTNVVVNVFKPVSGKMNVFQVNGNHFANASSPDKAIKGVTPILL